MMQLIIVQNHITLFELPKFQGHQILLEDVVLRFGYFTNVNIT